MNAYRLPAPLLLSLLLLGCVTINVYFPAAAAQEAADRIIRDVYGETPTAPAEQPQAPANEAPEPQSRQERAPGHPLAALLDLLIGPAAAQADINIETPAIQRLKSALKRRHDQLAPYYERGAIGMTNDGLLEVRDLKAVPLPERRRLQQLVSEENADRQALYAEIARANGHPEWKPEIQATFARRWVSNAPSGWWHEDAQGNWKRN
jgi:uncharacterized protein YdbL (DUF1318 family)